MSDQDPSLKAALEELLQRIKSLKQGPSREEILQRATAVFDAQLQEVPPERRDAMVAVWQFRITLMSETDRGSALMATAYLDDRLRTLLELKLVDDSKLTKRAFDFNGPLGTFSSRIDFAYLLGLIPKKACADLHKLRKIRNEFAHVAGPIDFKTEEILKHCEGLTYLGMGNDYSTGTRFRRTTMRLLTLIEEAIANCEHIDAAPELDDLMQPLPLEDVKAIWASIGQGAYPYGDKYADPG